MTWQWWVSQGFAVVGLVFIVVSMQQKTRVRILFFNLVATAFLLASVCFLWQLSAIVLMGVNTVRNITALGFACYPNTKRVYIWLTSAVLAIALIALNIVFWKSWLNILSITIGIGFIVAFMQTKPKNLRAIIVGVRLVAIVYWGLLLAPINASIEVIGLISTIVGIVRFDLKREIPLLGGVPR